jgi:hypothetical protein
VIFEDGSQALAGLLKESSKQSLYIHRGQLTCFPSMGLSSNERTSPSPTRSPPKRRTRPRPLYRVK